MGLRALFFSGFWIILFMPIVYAFPEETAVLDRPVIEKRPQAPSWMDVIDSKKGVGGAKGSTGYAERPREHKHRRVYEKSR